MRSLILSILLFFSQLAFAPAHKISLQKFEAPKYPPIARAAHITGDVQLALESAADGTIKSVKVVSGHPMLKDAALNTIKTWKFHCDDCKFGEEFQHVLYSLL